MAAIKLINLLAITSLALFASTLTTHVNALGAGHQHLNRQISHEGIAHRATKRANGRRCKAKSSSVAPTSTSAVTSISVQAAHVQISTSVEVAPSNSPEPKPSPAPSPPAKPAPAPPPSSGGGNAGQGKVGIAWNGGNDPSLGNLVTDNTH